MGEYKIDSLISMKDLPLSPRSHGIASSNFKPSNSKELTINEGIGMVKDKVSLSEENEEKVVLQWLYKEDKQDEDVKHVEISPRKYGKGYNIMKQMGYKGKLLIGTNDKGLIEPIHMEFYNSKEKKRLGYGEQRSNSLSRDGPIFDHGED